jgi:hypothetical protein
MTRWKAFVGTGVLGLIVGVGIAWATIPDSNGVIHTCFKNNNWRVIDAPGASCSGSETPLDFNPGAVRSVIRTETHTLAPSEVATFTAHCGAGEMATGGGWRLVGPNPVGPLTVDGSVPQSSAPEPSAGQTPIGWKVVGVHNSDSVPHDVTAFAVCAPAWPAP